MRNSKNQWKVTMINLEQLKKKRYTGFKTPKAIKQFCTRHHVNAFWWRPPQGNKKIFMVDEKNFRECYKEFHYTKNPVSRTTTRPKATTSTWKNRAKSVRLHTKTKSYSSTKTPHARKTYKTFKTYKTYRRAA